VRYWTFFLKFITEFIPVVLMCVVTSVIAADVVGRTAFSRPVFAASEIALIGFVWLVWLGAVGVAVRNDMMGIQFFVERLGRFRVPAEILSDVLVIAICGFCAYATYRQISTARFTIFDSLHWPKWILAVGVAISLVLFIIIYCGRLLNRMRGHADVSHNPADPL
jgi:TRAP-type C4-dicarboxylate transport system permease small subunit